MESIKEQLFYVWSLIRALGTTVSFWDVIDMAIIAYLIYRGLTVMRKTSAGSVIKGIIVVLAVVWVSSLLKLKLVSYFLNHVIRMGVFIIVVLFQPELRKLFEQMGSRNLSFLFRKRVKLENVEAAIQNVVSSCEVMGKSKTGALIVFERDIGLNDYVATGTRVDAIASSELLQNIFYKNSPLHDGAVIVREGRIVAAACMLAMSNNVNLSRDLGMRHRAGVGISERSDAVAVMVSEQTGAISVAVDGMLKRHLTRDTFEKLLSSELTMIDGAKREGSGLRGLKVKK